MDNIQKKLMGLMDKKETLEHLIYVVDDSQNENEFKMIVAEMIKAKIVNANFVFYVETKSKENYEYLHNRVFCWGNESSVLPLVGDNLRSKMIKLSKKTICMKCDLPKEKKLTATENSFVFGYEK
jgi:hypothetical protein